MVPIYKVIMMSLENVSAERAVYYYCVGMSSMKCDNMNMNYTIPTQNTNIVITRFRGAYHF